MCNVPAPQQEPFRHGYDGTIDSIMSGVASNLRRVFYTCQGRNFKGKDADVYLAFEDLYLVAFENDDEEHAAQVQLMLDLETGTAELFPSTYRALEERLAMLAREKGN